MKSVIMHHPIIAGVVLASVSVITGAMFTEMITTYIDAPKWLIGSYMIGGVYGCFLAFILYLDANDLF